MPTVIPSELIFLAYLDNPFPGIQRRAQEIFELIEQSVYIHTERWLVLESSLTQATNFIVEQSIAQSVEGIRSEIESRGIEIANSTDVQVAQAQAAEGECGDTEILYAVGQQFSIFAFYPETFARKVQTCEQRYGVSLSALKIVSEADLVSSLSQSNPASSDEGEHTEDGSDSSTDAASIEHSTLSRSGVESVISSSSLLSWISASLIPLLLRQGQLSAPTEDGPVDASGLKPLNPAPLAPTASRFNGIETRNALTGQAQILSNKLSQSTRTSTEAASRQTESQTDDELIGDSRYLFLDESSSTDIVAKATSTSVSDSVQDRLSQVEGDIPPQASPNPNQNHPKLEKLSQPIASENLPKLEDIADPTVPGGSASGNPDSPPQRAPLQPSPILPISPVSTTEAGDNNPINSPNPVVPTNGSEPITGSDVEQPNGSFFNPLTLNGLGGRFIIEIPPRAGQIVITHFGGVGTGTYPSQSTIEEADILKFTGGTSFNAQNMILAQEGDDLVIRFEGVVETEIILKNFQMENLDNLLRPSASVDLANTLFNEQDNPQDSYDIFDADWELNQVLNPNTTTFLNDKDNQVNGYEESDDVINGQEGNDTLLGLGGDDVLRGGLGNDILLGGAGDNSLMSNEGNDVYVLSISGFSQINDFASGQDMMSLPKNIAYEQLEIRQGTGSYSKDIWILFDNKPLALVKNTQASDLTADKFLSGV